MTELFYRMIEQSKIGAGITGSTFFGGMLLKMDPNIMQSVNDILQMIAFVVTIVVGILTIIGMLKKRKKEK